MYRARDHLVYADHLDTLTEAAADLDLDDEARSDAVDLLLNALSDLDDPEERTIRALVAASLYAGALLAGQERPQGAVADAVGVSRLTVQQRWKDLLDDAGLDTPTW